MVALGLMDLVRLLLEKQEGAGGTCCERTSTWVGRCSGACICTLALRSTAPSSGCVASRASKHFPAARAVAASVAVMAQWMLVEVAMVAVAMAGCS